MTQGTALPGSTGGRSQALALAGVVLVSLLVRVVWLGGQPLNADDLDVAVTARNFTETGWPEPTMWNHPRLRDLLVSLSLALLGDGPWGIKLWSVLLGSATAATTALLTRDLTGNLFVGLLAGLLVAVDPLHADFSRQGINDVYLGFFPQAVLLAAWRYRRTKRSGWLLLAGLLFGLGLASKWSVAFPVAAGAALLLADLRRLPDRRSLLDELAFLFACLALLPLAVYAATFLPWFLRGYSVAEWVDLHQAMAYETATHTGYGTKLPGYLGEIVGAWQWFLRPLYYVDAVPDASGAPAGYLIGFSNPLTWLLVLPALLFAAWRALCLRDRAAALLAGLFLSGYLPFVAVSRPVWTNSAVAVVPLAMPLVAFASVALFSLTSRLAKAAVGVWAVAALASAALLWFPAVGIQTSLGDRAIAAIVPPEAYLSRRPQ